MVKKKSKSDPPPVHPSTPEQLNIELSAQIPALESVLINRTLHRQSHLEQTRVQASSADVLRTLAIASDLARCYKALQEDLIAEINSLESKLTEYREEAEMAKHELALMARDKDDEIAIKDQVIFDLKVKINEMTGEFGVMLGNAVNLLKVKLVAAAAGANTAVVSLDDAMSGKANVAYLQRLQDFTVAN
jgi:hypothetical protein